MPIEPTNEMVEKAFCSWMGGKGRDWRAGMRDALRAALAVMPAPEPSEGEARAAAINICVGSFGKPPETLKWVLGNAVRKAKASQNTSVPRPIVGVRQKDFGFQVATLSNGGHMIWHNIPHVEEGASDVE